MKRYALARYILLDNDKVIDTTKIYPHTECYLECSGYLYVEFLDGTEHSLGKIIVESDSIEDINI